MIKNRPVITNTSPLLIRNLIGEEPFPYHPVWLAMKTFNAKRTIDTSDEIWVMQHQPVYTLGKAGKEHHLLNPKNQIPLVRSDRGGQITYHGPGQWMLYCLWDIVRLNVGIRSLVKGLEQLIIELCAAEDIKAKTIPGAPGVYVGKRKLCAIGLRVSKGRCYHGLACNMQLDLTPFKSINPCGYSDMEATSWQQELNHTRQTNLNPAIWQQNWLQRLQQRLQHLFAFEQIKINTEIPPLLKITEDCQ